MTAEEIKGNISMDEVLSRYGIKVGRNRMASCPFHGNDKHPSMKVYKDGYHCFTCGANGDIFKFVQEYEGIGFSEAFKVLGGTYEHESPEKRKARETKVKRERDEREAKAKAEAETKLLLSDCIKAVRLMIAIYEPYSEMWCYAINVYPELVGIWESKYLKGEEVNRLDVYRRCREIGQKIGIR